MCKGACYLIGEGRSIDIWKDPWVPFAHKFRPLPRGERRVGVNLVSDFILFPEYCWDISKIRQVFEPDDVNHILSIQLSPNSGDDRLAWIPNASGKFSVKSAYLTECESRFILNGPCSSKVWKALWKVNIHERYKLFLWKLYWNILSVRAVINSRFPIPDVLCLLCKLEVETARHVFLECNLVEFLWWSSSWALRIDAFAHLVPH
ncbi:hypothetical protein L1049_008994 [Liquidambar formosana]|uniref:Reverse transcriptase zinc-binding domain-containing protein n=1 Tax=Liquidambar formosana TaxID=63359 RepID=A0AAP0X4Y3_LIQFO